MSDFSAQISQYLAFCSGKDIGDADIKELYHAVGYAAMKSCEADWKQETPGKRALYLSAEFLVGRMVYNNLLNLGLYQEFCSLFEEHGLDINLFEEIDDAALGNGGLGRLAACFLDSAATEGIPLDGYGIRYKYGLFRQFFENGFQKEAGDDWTSYGDPWSVRKDGEKQLVHYAGQTVYAVPYDMPVIGYDSKTVNTLRLWQAEPLCDFNFQAFNDQDYTQAVAQRTAAEDISKVLYPNDDGIVGKSLRLKQEYFFSAATLQDVVGKYKKKHGSLKGFEDAYAIQLNDTHPTIAIPELLRILMHQEKMDFTEAFQIVQKTFAYTNHTIMPEALETWDTGLLLSVIPQVYPYIVMLDDALARELAAKGIGEESLQRYRIVDGNTIHMARLAIYATHSINGVAALHTEILKNTALHEWYELFPERFNNKTNGITQRRWLALCNPELSALVTEKVGDSWMKDLPALKGLEDHLTDETADAFIRVKQEKKRQLADYLLVHEGVEVNPESIFDIQVKRLHEYKRQLLNAFGILDLYFGIKDGSIDQFHPMTFVFGAKAAPGYFRAKGIIKFINEIASLVNNDEDVNGKLKVVFVQNYNVSYAEKLIPAADVSEQISTAGTEASGTGNMKFMLNGAVTLGTYDGANVEIVAEAGEENNYIFGATVEEIRDAAPTYDPMKIYQENPRIRRVLDTLVDGTFSDDKTGMFRELYESILEGASWHKPDQYYLLLDFPHYTQRRLELNRDFGSQREFARKCLLNIARAGKFSSDRTIRQYADEIWNMEK